MEAINRIRESVDTTNQMIYRLEQQAYGNETREERRARERMEKKIDKKTARLGRQPAKV